MFEVSEFVLGGVCKEIGSAGETSPMYFLRRYSTQDSRSLGKQLKIATSSLLARNSSVIQAPKCLALRISSSNCV